ncbi:MAG: DUF2911 domain-containing protein [Psychroserpens sp.]|nr:DUF2911 domain-containing protein [Psychroserpens sp.]
MKSFTLISAILTVVFTLTSIDVTAQDFPPLDKSPMDAAVYPSNYEVSRKLIKIIYSRPLLRDRSIESLVPLEEVWRTGANEAAEITLYVDMRMGDQKVPAGTYTFYLINQGEQWTAVINRATNVWGSYFYDKKLDVARYNVPVEEGKEPIEAFSIFFKESEEDIRMNVGWDRLRLKIPFSKI